jgi:3-hydroxybutyryl-CoA dehydratase
MELSDTFEYKFSFTQEDVDNFAKVTGDYNPIHIDETIARHSIFKKRIVHGFLSGSVFSRVFGTIWPGEGTIYLSQTMNFLKPMYTSVEYSAKFLVLDILPKNKFWIETIVFDDNLEIAIEGKALIKISV